MWARFCITHHSSSHDFKRSAQREFQARSPFQEPGTPALHGTGCPHQPAFPSGKCALRMESAQLLSCLVLAGGCRRPVPGYSESCCGERDCVSHALTFVSWKVADRDICQGWILLCKKMKVCGFRRNFCAPRTRTQGGARFSPSCPDCTGETDTEPTTVDQEPTFSIFIVSGLGTPMTHQPVSAVPSPGQRLPRFLFLLSLCTHCMQHFSPELAANWIHFSKATTEQ